MVQILLKVIDGLTMDDAVNVMQVGPPLQRAAPAPILVVRVFCMRTSPSRRMCTGAGASSWLNCAHCVPCRKRTSMVWHASSPAPRCVRDSNRGCSGACRGCVLLLCDSKVRGVSVWHPAHVQEDAETYCEGLRGNGLIASVEPDT